MQFLTTRYIVTDEHTLPQNTILELFKNRPNTDLQPVLNEVKIPSILIEAPAH